MSWMYKKHVHNPVSTSTCSSSKDLREYDTCVVSCWCLLAWFKKKHASIFLFSSCILEMIIQVLVNQDSFWSALSLFLSQLSSDSTGSHCLEKNVAHSSRPHGPPRYFWAISPDQTSTQTKIHIKSGSDPRIEAQKKNAPALRWSWAW